MPAKITVNSNGSLRVEGEFTIVDPQGNVYDTTGKPAVSLCRCGQTKKSPFCDGSHKACGFDSPASAVSQA
jgi:CDGSH-type Zn-finger protein